MVKTKRWKRLRAQELAFQSHDHTRLSRFYQFVPLSRERKSENIINYPLTLDMGGGVAAAG